MENFVFCLNVILPIFITIGIGYLVRQLKWVSDESLKQFNSVCFKVFLSTLLFMSLYKTDLKSIFNLNLTLFCCGTVLLSFLAFFFFIPLIEKDKTKYGVMIQGSFRSNFLLFGIPIVSNLYGYDGLGTASMMICFIVMEFNILAVFVLEYHRNNGKKSSWTDVFKSLCKNPLIIGVLLGIIFMLFHIKLPSAVEEVASDFAAAASPLALFILGGSLKFTAIQNNLKQLILCLTNKLILLPCIFIPLAIFLGFTRVELATIIALFATPVAVSSFTMAQQMEGDSDLAGLLVVFSSLLSVVSLFVWLFITKQLGLL